MPFFRLSIVVASMTLAALGCTAEPGAGELGGPSGSGPVATRPEPSTSPTGDRAPTEAADGGTADAARGNQDAAAPEPREATLAITDASFKNAPDSVAMAAGAKARYDFAFTLKNASNVAVTAEDSLVVDFGGGRQVSVSIGDRCQPAPGSPAATIEPGESAPVTNMWLWVDARGAVVASRIPCLRTNVAFGGVHPGSAPATATFPGSITLKLRGKTEDGTFVATGAAARAR